MTSERQPEALRLAECLDEPLYATHKQMTEAAAELQRLHASCEDYSHHKQRQDQRILMLYAQRDALLEACKTLMSLPETEDWAATLRLAVEQARAAIAKAEENTNAGNV